MVETSSGIDLDAVTFTGNDRCARCVAQAYAKAFGPHGEQLEFCAHHINKYGQTLFERGWEIVSHTEALEQIGARIPVYV